MSIYDPVELYRARGLPEAHAIRLALEQQGIAVRIDNEILQGAVGELPMGWATAPRIMVDRGQAEPAVRFLQGFLERRPDADRDDESDDGCLACGADMGNAVTCPACGWSFVEEPEAFLDRQPMTEAEWRTSDDGHRMLELVRARLTDQRLSLFIAACTAAYPDQVTDLGAVNAFAAGLLRCLTPPLGRPRSPVPVNADALELARAVEADGDFGRLPVLADALLDAGCTDEEVLAHCRSAGPHFKGCWALGLVLGKE